MSDTADEKEYKRFVITVSVDMSSPSSLSLKHYISTAP